MLEQLRILYGYNRWANARVLAAADGLTEQEFTRELDGAGSLRTILGHTAGAHAVWLERWQGRSPTGPWELSDLPDVASLRTHWEEIERATRAYLDTLREEDLDQIVAYTNFRGERWAYPRWQALLHQVNHATQHRSEAAVMLTQLGHSPGDLDFLIYMDQGGR